MHRYAREFCLGLAVGCVVGLSGCGEAGTPPAPATEAPKPALVDAPKTKVKGKVKKGGNPTADMELKEVREYRRTHPTGTQAQ